MINLINCEKLLLGEQPKYDFFHNDEVDYEANRTEYSTVIRVGFELNWPCLQCEALGRLWNWVAKSASSAY